MRERKYRIWYHGKMVYKSLSDMLTDPSNNFMFLDGEVMECIGLLDKNDKEMYEDDIVEFQTFDAKGIVTYTAPRFHASGCDLQGYEFEIIGNRYENPDLAEACIP